MTSENNYKKYAAVLIPSGKQLSDFMSLYDH
jgi:hypothetical protein